MIARSRVLRMKLEIRTHRMLSPAPVSAVAACYPFYLTSDSQTRLANKQPCSIGSTKLRGRDRQKRSSNTRCSRIYVTKACCQRCGCCCALLLGVQADIPLSPTCPHWPWEAAKQASSAAHATSPCYDSHNLPYLGTTQVISMAQTPPGRHQRNGHCSIFFDSAAPP